MSAFVVSKDHIDAMVQAGLSGSSFKLTWRHDGEHHELTHANADQVGAMLWAENVASVEHRYSPPGREAIYGEGWESEADFDLPGKYRVETIAPGVAPIEVPEWIGGYTFPLGRVKQLAPVAVLKAIDCFEYQSCEHPEWEGSEARAFCEALRDDMIGRLPGYSEADWEVRT